MIHTAEIALVRAKAKQVKAMVIGDAMLDQYIYGTVNRISPEAPVPVLSHKHSEIKAGGSANVALNLAAWGCETVLIGLSGTDANAGILANLLEAQGIRHHLFSSPNRPTTIKTRVVASSHHLLRIDEESLEDLMEEEETRANEYIRNTIRLEKPDLIILEDYNKGFLTEKIIATAIGTGRELGVFIAVDPKEKNFFQYRGVDLFKPNLREASQAAHKGLKLTDLADISAKWKTEMGVKALAITLGSQGIFWSDDQGDYQQRPERSVDVVDVCGAGDAVICALALGRMSGLSPGDILSLANLTGAYVCSHSGVVAVDVDVLEQWI